MVHAVESKLCTLLQSQDMIVHERDLRALQLRGNSSAPCEDVCAKAQARVANIEGKIAMLTKMKEALSESTRDDRNRRNRTPPQKHRQKV